MADVQFLGTALLEDATPATTDYSDNHVELTGGPERLRIAIAATLGTDHGFEIAGHSIVPFGFTMRGLTTAQKSTLNAFWAAKTWLEFLYKPLAGPKSTTNPEETFHFQLAMAATAPRNLTADYLYVVPDVQVAYYKWDDGVTPFTRGTAQLS